MINTSVVGARDVTYGDSVAAENSANRNSATAPTAAPSPTDISASLNREWWEDQQARFEPLQQMANDMLLDPEKRQGLINEGVNAVSNAVDDSFDRASTRLKTLRSRTNQQQSSRSMKSNSRLDRLSRTATTVGARNAARDYIRETETDLIGG